MYSKWNEALAMNKTLFVYGCEENYDRNSLMVQKTIRCYKVYPVRPSDLIPGMQVLDCSDSALIDKENPVLTVAGASESHSGVHFVHTDDGRKYCSDGWGSLAPPEPAVAPEAAPELENVREKVRQRYLLAP